MWSSVLLLLWTAAWGVQGEGEIQVRMMNYANPEGTLHNGHCCDGWPLRCERNGGCDYYFRICLDEMSGLDTTKSCKYGYHRSNKVGDNMVDVVFGDEFGGVPNPITFRIPEPVDGRDVRLKIDVKEEDRWTKGDYVDYFSQPIKLVKGIFPELHFPVEMESRTRLLVTVTVKCAPGYYGEQCMAECKEPGQRDHYVCDAWSGDKICQPGWTGGNCNRRENRRQSKRRRP